MAGIPGSGKFDHFYFKADGTREPFWDEYGVDGSVTHFVKVEIAGMSPVYSNFDMWRSEWVVDAYDNKTIFEYDAISRISRIRRPNGVDEVYSYNPTSIVGPGKWDDQLYSAVEVSYATKASGALPDYTIRYLFAKDMSKPPAVRAMMRPFAGDKLIRAYGARMPMVQARGADGLYVLPPDLVGVGSYHVTELVYGASGRVDAVRHFLADSYLPNAVSSAPTTYLQFSYLEIPAGSGFYRVGSETNVRSGHTWNFQYQADSTDYHRLLWSKRACSETGTTVSTQYDLWQRPTSVTTEVFSGGRPRELDPDAGGAVEPSSITVSYTYGTCGTCRSKPTAIVGAAGRQWTWEYDAITGLVTTHKYPSPGGVGFAEEHYFWQPLVAGELRKGYRLHRRTDAGGRQWNIVYGSDWPRADPVHGVKAEVISEDSPVVSTSVPAAAVSSTIIRNRENPTFSVHAGGLRQDRLVGMVQEFTDGNGVTTEYLYNDAGLLLTEVRGANAAPLAQVRTELRYDAYYRPNQVIERSGSTAAQTFYIEYNSAGRVTCTRATFGLQNIQYEERFFYDVHGNFAVRLVKNLDEAGSLPLPLKGAATIAREWIRDEWHYDYNRLVATYEDRRPLNEGSEGVVADAPGARFLRTILVWLPRGLVGSIGLPNGATVDLTYDGYGSLYKRVLRGVGGEELTSRVFVNGALESVRLIEGVGASKLVTTIDRNAAGVIEVVHEPGVAHPGGLYPSTFGIKFARHEFDTDILGQTIEARIVDATNSTLMRKVKSFYDELGRVYRIEMPDVLGGPATAVQQVTWTGASKATRVTDSAGRFVQRTFDALGRVTQVEDSRSGQANKIIYEFLDKTDFVARTKTNNFDEVAGAYVERVAAYTYDTLGRVTQVAVGATNPLVSHYKYFATGDVQTFTDPSGKVQKFLPDALGRLTQRLLPGAAPIWNGATHQDFAGSATSQTIQEDGKGRLTTSVMDFAGRLRAIAEPGSTVMPTAAAPNQPYAKYFVYDGASRVARMHTGQDGVLDFVRDGAGRVLARVRGWNPAIAPEDHIVSLYYGADLLEWDALGRPVQMRCLFGDGTTYVDEQFTYDGLGRRTAEKFKDLFGTVWNTVESKFVGADPFRREVNYLHGAGGTADDLFVATTPTENGRLGTIGWATTAAATKVQLAAYSHEGSSIRKRRTFIPSSSLTNFDTNYSYDHYGRMTEVAHSFDVHAGVKLQYDPVSHLPTGFEYKKQGDALAAGDRFAYDEHHRLAKSWLSSHSMSADPDTVAFQKRMTYGMDEANNRTSLAEKLGQTAPETVTGYIPDSGATTGGTPSNRYEDVGGIKPLYDTRGNLVFDGQFYIVYDANNRAAQILKATLASSSSMAMSSSWGGELEGGSVYGEAASLESGPVVPMTPQGLEALEAARAAMMARIGTNPAALLQRATDPTLAEEAVEPILMEPDPGQQGVGAMAMASLAATSQPVLELVAIYSYDAFNRRVGRFVNQVSYFSYTWDGWHEAEEYRNTIVGSQYVWGEQLDELVAYRYREANSWASFYVAEGGEHSPARILNQSGAVSEIQEYDPYGRTYRFNQTGTPIGLSAVGNPYGWKGHRVDDETGFVYMRNRHYHTGWGRFLSSDPIGVWGDGGNLGNQYAYGWMLPTAVVDRYGEWGWVIFAAIVAVVDYAVVAVATGDHRAAAASAAAVFVAGVTLGVAAPAIVGPVSAAYVSAAVSVPATVVHAAIATGKPPSNQQVLENMVLAGAGGAVSAAMPQGGGRTMPTGGKSGGGGASPASAGGAPSRAAAPASKMVPNPCPQRTVGQPALKSPSAATKVVDPPEVFAPRPVKPQDAVGRWEQFLGPGPHSNRHPRLGIPDPNRLVSVDGKRSIRYGSHEMDSKPSKHHYHEETWTYDPVNDIMRIDTLTIRVPLR